MTVFISHSFDDRPEFDNVVDCLVGFDVPYWDPGTIRSAESLRDQLRSAIAECTVCVFVATHNSVRSSWCGAELGAFWGRGTPVIVYLADGSVTEDQLPPIVRGDIWERRLTRVAHRAKELVVTGSAVGGGATAVPTARVGNLTVEQLEKVIAGAVSLVRAEENSGSGTGDTGVRVRNAAGRVMTAVDATSRLAEDTGSAWRYAILWVDDRPDNNRYERQAFEALGYMFTLAESTGEAMEILAREDFGAIISDMGRREGTREGYALLDQVRAAGISTPYFIYAGSRSPQHSREAKKRGAQGSTNAPSELLAMVTDALGDVADHGPF